MLPTRDGTYLHTLIYLPKGASSTNKVPTVIDRSPYGYGDMEWITDIFLPFGFAGNFFRIFLELNHYLT